MILITGGAASGKKTYAGKIGYKAEDIIDATYLCTSEEAAAGLAAGLRNTPVIIMSELGCGIVPADEELIHMRECSGRLMCALAAEADTVVRMVCGIPTVIKGELP